MHITVFETNKPLYFAVYYIASTFYETLQDNIGKFSLEGQEPLEKNEIEGCAKIASIYDLNSGITGSTWRLSCII